MTNYVRWPDSEDKNAELLILTTVDGLLRCPGERKEEATQEAFQLNNGRDEGKEGQGA